MFIALTASLSSSSASILISSSLASPILSLDKDQSKLFCNISIIRVITLKTCKVLFLTVMLGDLIPHLVFENLYYESYNI